MSIDTSKIVTDIHGRPLASLPKGQRRKAKRQVIEQLTKPIWADANVDPQALQRQAHVAANSRRSTAPTRSSEKRRAIREAC